MALTCGRRCRPCAAPPRRSSDTRMRSCAVSGDRRRRRSWSPSCPSWQRVPPPSSSCVGRCWARATRATPTSSPASSQPPPGLDEHDQHRRRRRRPRRSKAKAPAKRAEPEAKVTAIEKRRRQRRARCGGAPVPEVAPAAARGGGGGRQRRRRCRRRRAHPRVGSRPPREGAGPGGAGSRSDARRRGSPRRGGRRPRRRRSVLSFRIASQRSISTDSSVRRVDA